MTNARNNAAKTAVAAAKASKPANAAAPKPEAALVQDAQRFAGKLCKINGGRNHKGETLKVFFVTKGSERRKPLALCEGDTALAAGDAPIFMNVSYLEIVGDMTKADIDRLNARQQQQSDETFYVAATVTHDGDKAVQLAVPGWFKRVYFTKPNGDNAGMISKTGFTDATGLDIFEIAAWKVRKECGQDSYNVLKAKQPEFAAIVEAK